MKQKRRNLIAAAIATIVMIGASPLATADAVTLLNVSYDPTRELYTDFTPRSPSIGKREQAIPLPSSSHTAAPAARLARS